MIKFRKYCIEKSVTKLENKLILYFPMFFLEIEVCSLHCTYLYLVKLLFTNMLLYSKLPNDPTINSSFIHLVCCSGNKLRT